MSLMNINEMLLYLIGRVCKHLKRPYIRSDFDQIGMQSLIKISDSCILMRLICMLLARIVSFMYVYIYHNACMIIHFHLHLMPHEIVQWFPNYLEPTPLWVNKWTSNAPFYIYSYFI